MKNAPGRTKYRKAHKGKIKGKAGCGYLLAFGSYGLKSLTAGRFTAKQMEAARRCITRYMKRTGKLWIKVFPHIPVTGKPAEVRMGKGKGSINYYMFRVKPGTILYEVDGVKEEMAVEALRKAAQKLPFKTKIVKRV